MEENHRVNHGASAAAIQFHYDVSNRFYELWLDPTLTYSAALYERGDNLEDAQLRKIDYHIEQARASRVERLLDVGCGWGSVLKRSVQIHGVKRGHGLTLSQRQRDWIDGFGIEAITVSLKSWTDFEPDEPYDAIISIGAFEHFGRIEQSDQEKIESYRTFFSCCRDWLRPGGRLSLQTFSYGTSRDRAKAKKTAGTQFLARDIFPETDPPRLSDIAHAIDGILEIERLRNDRMDYARTCRDWIARIKKNRKPLVALAGDETVTKYENYLKLSVIGFQMGFLDLYRLTLKRPA